MAMIIIGDEGVRRLEKIQYHFEALHKKNEEAMADTCRQLHELNDKLIAWPAENPSVQIARGAGKFVADQNGADFIFEDGRNSIHLDFEDMKRLGFWLNAHRQRKP